MWSKYTEDHFNVICIIDCIVCMHVMYCTINIHTTICETWVSEGKPEFLNILTISIYYVFNFRFSIANRSLWKIWNNYSFIGIAKKAKNILILIFQLLHTDFKCNFQFKMESNSKMLWHQIFWLNSYYRPGSNQF